MTRWISLLLLSLILAACVPGMNGLEPNPQVIYDGAKRDVYNQVLSLIAADPGIPAYGNRGASGGWLISNSDFGSGLITARAVSRGGKEFLDDVSDEVHALSVVLTQVTPQTTRLIIQGTPRAAPLIESLYSNLNATFGQAP